MQILYQHKNTYTVFKDGEPIGWIRFVRWVDRAGWFIDEVSEGLPVTKADFDASIAKDKLTAHGLTWQAGENKPFYLYK